jgi:xylulose-5-phosphate/fructose-6-phosphate phosphoketolase
MKHLLRQFSFPSSTPSHSAHEMPDSILEGSEIDYARALAYGALLGNPGLLVACKVAEGEAKTGGSLATTKLASSI